MAMPAGTPKFTITMNMPRSRLGAASALTAMMFGMMPPSPTAEDVHPSVGSGTRMALQDAIAPAKALGECGDVPATFETFERERRGAVGSFQEAAMRSIVWYETVSERTHLDPVAFAYDCMMRTRRVSNERQRLLV